MLHWGKTLAVAGALGFAVLVGGATSQAAPLGVSADRPAQADTLVVPVHGYARPRGRYEEYLPLPYYEPDAEVPRRSYSSRYYAPYHHRPHYGSYYGAYSRPYYAPPVVYYETDRSINRRLRVGHPHDVARCLELFRSYNVYTGTYITYDGEVRTCPFID